MRKALLECLEKQTLMNHCVFLLVIDKKSILDNHANMIMRKDWKDVTIYLINWAKIKQTASNGLNDKWWAEQQRHACYT